MAREHDDRMMDAPMDRQVETRQDRGMEQPAMGTADLLAAAEGRQQPVVRGATDPAMGSPQASSQHMQQDPHREALAALFEPSAAEGFRERWRDVQSGFVDDPRQAVAHADELVAQVMKSLAESFARQRSHIEDEVGQGNAQASTENLRVALTRYRSFFERLLSL